MKNRSVVICESKDKSIRGPGSISALQRRLVADACAEQRSCAEASAVKVLPCSVLALLCLAESCLVLGRGRGALVSVAWP